VVHVTVLSASRSLTANTLFPSTYIDVSVISWTASVLEYYTPQTFDVIVYISTLTRIAVAVVIPDQPIPEARGMSNGVLIGSVCGGAVVLAFFAGFVIYLIRRGRDTAGEFTDDDVGAHKFTINSVSTLPADGKDMDADSDALELMRPPQSENGGSDIGLRVPDRSEEIFYVCPSKRPWDPPSRVVEAGQCHPGMMSLKDFVQMHSISTSVKS
jgi:hypothetical protein